MDDQVNQTGPVLYETDFYSWTQEQAALPRDGRVSAADLANIAEELESLEDLLDDNPGLKSNQDAAFAKGYVRGRRDAADETGLALASFPSDPPFTREQADSFWPKSFPRRTPGNAKDEI